MRRRGSCRITERAALAGALAHHLGQGDIETRRSLSRAFVMIGEEARAAIDAAAESDDEAVRVHALATRALMDDPDAGFEGAVDHARRVKRPAQRADGTGRAHGAADVGRPEGTGTPDA